MRNEGDKVVWRKKKTNQLTNSKVSKIPFEENALGLHPNEFSIISEAEEKSDVAAMATEAGGNSKEQKQKSDNAKGEILQVVILPPE